MKRRKQSQRNRNLQARSAYERQSRFEICEERLQLSGASPASDLSPVIEFAIQNESFSEAVGTINLTVHLSAACTDSITIPLIFGGPAKLGLDFDSPFNTITIPSGAISGNVPINIHNDLGYEPDESLVVTLGTPSLGMIGSWNSTTVTIVNDDILPSLFLVSPNSKTSEAAGNITIAAQLSTPYFEDIIVPVTIGGTATADLDYTSIDNQFLIPAGATTASIIVSIIDDSLPETDEYITFQPTRPTNLSSSFPQGTSVIIGDNDRPVVQFSTVSESVNEGGGNVVVSALLQTPSNQDISVPITVGGSATNGPDFSVNQSSVLIPAGETSATFTVNLIDDTSSESSETIILTLGISSFGNVGTNFRHTIQIIDNDTVPNVQFSVATQTVTEFSGTFHVTVALSNYFTQPVTVPLTITGTALAGDDFTLPTTDLLIPAGSLSVEVDGSLSDDTEPESTETIIVTLGLPINATLRAVSVQTISILDNDSLPQVQFQGFGTSFKEHEGTKFVTLSLTNPSTQPVIVPFSFDGIATLNSDYTFPEAVTFAPGTTKTTVSLVLNDDNLRETSEYASIDIGTPLNATLGANYRFQFDIFDNDPFPTLNVGAAQLVVREDLGGIVLVPFVLSNPTSAGDVSVVVTIDSPTAKLGKDYTVQNPVVIPAGSSVGFLSIAVIDDVLSEDSEPLYLTVHYQSLVNAKLGDKLGCTVTIIDDDPLPVATLQTSDHELHEFASEESLQIDVTLSEPAGRTVAIPISFAGTAILYEDFTWRRLSESLNLLIPAGQTSASFEIVTNFDLLFEQTEQVIISLNASSSVAIVSPQELTVTILDDDPMPAVSFTQSDQFASEASGSFVISVKLDAVSGSPVTVPFIVNATATSGDDYALVDNQFEIPAGETTASIVMPVFDDTLTEMIELVNFTLGTPSLAVLGNQKTEAIHILDNERPQISVGDASTIEGNNGTTTLNFPVERRGDPTGTIVVEYKTGDPSDSANPINDFIPQVGQVTFLPREDIKVIAVPVLADQLDESDETASLILTKLITDPLTFGPQQILAVPEGPEHFAPADYNGDGRLDLLLNTRGDVLKLFPNTTPGDAPALIFSPPESLSAKSSAGTQNLDVVTADINIDGKPDVIAINERISENLDGVAVFINTTFPGDFDPTFSSPVNFVTGNNAVGTGASSLAVQDLNSDGKPDLLVLVNEFELDVYFNQTAQGSLTPSFGPPQSLTGQFSFPINILTGDLNGDGVADIAIPNTGAVLGGAYLLNMYLNNTPVGSDTFLATYQSIDIGARYYAPKIADVNSDNLNDFVFLQNDTVAVILNTTPSGSETTSFSGTQNFSTGINSGAALVAEDLNADGRVDFVAGNLRIFLNETPAGENVAHLSAPIPLATRRQVFDITARDFNGDNKPDLIIAEYPEQSVLEYVNMTVEHATIFRDQGIGTIVDDDGTPRVTNVYVRGSAWKEDFLKYLDDHSLGDTTFGFELQTSISQLKTLPWSTIDTISVKFDRDVTIASSLQDNLGLIGSTDVLTTSTFSYDTTNHVAAWKFSTPLARDKFLLHLPSAAITNSLGAPLDGEWTNPSVNPLVAGSSFPSGDGIAGGDFDFRFNVLPGDTDRNGGVTGLDGLAFRGVLGFDTTSANYSPYLDVDGNGKVAAADGMAVRKFLGQALPRTEPVVSTAGNHAFDVAIAFNALNNSTGSTNVTTNPLPANTQQSTTTTVAAAPPPVNQQASQADGAAQNRTQSLTTSTASVDKALEGLDLAALVQATLAKYWAGK